jgi:hypothetical protein
MRRPAPSCDHCGGPLDALADAVARLRYDRDDVLVEAGLDHRACAAGPSEPEGRIELLPARDLLLDGRSAERLAAVARLHNGASVRRIVRKAERVAAGAA